MKLRFIIKSHGNDYVSFWKDFQGTLSISYDSTKLLLSYSGNILMYVCRWCKFGKRIRKYE